MASVPGILLNSLYSNSYKQVVKAASPKIKAKIAQVGFTQTALLILSCNRASSSRI